MTFSVKPDESSWFFMFSFSCATATMDVSTKRRMLMSRSRMVWAKATICASSSSMFSPFSLSAALLSKARYTCSWERSSLPRLTNRLMLVMVKNKISALIAPSKTRPERTARRWTLALMVR
jgi:hypothetical protein